MVVGQGQAFGLAVALPQGDPGGEQDNAGADAEAVRLFTQVPRRCAVERQLHVPRFE
ncbi:hypothetical protein D3C76_1831920 [compost metagenome]